MAVNEVATLTGCYAKMYGSFCGKKILAIMTIWP